MNRTTHRQFFRKGSDAGAATAELAVMLPLCFIMLLGTVDFGRAMYQLTVVANAATAGARYGTHDSAHSGDISGIQAAARNDLLTSLPAIDVVVAADRYCICEDGGTIDCTTGACAGGPGLKRAYVRVRVDKPYSPLFPYPGVPNPVMLSRETQMRIQ